MSNAPVTHEEMIALDLMLAGFHYRALEAGQKGLEAELARARTNIAAEKEIAFGSRSVGRRVFPGILVSTGSPLAGELERPVRAPTLVFVVFSVQLIQDKPLVVLDVAGTEARASELSRESARSGLIANIYRREVQL